MSARTAAATVACAVAVVSAAATGPASAAAMVLRPATPLTLLSTSGCQALGADKYECEAFATGGSGSYYAVWNGKSSDTTFGPSTYSVSGGACTTGQWVAVSLVVHDSVGATVSAQYGLTCLGGPILP